MSFLRWIHYINNFNPSNFLPFTIEGQQVGWIKKQHLVHFQEFPFVFQTNSEAIQLHPRLNTPDKRTTTLTPILEQWRDAKILPRWYHEMYPVATGLYRPPLMLIERAAAPFFGIRAYGIHVNGIVVQKQNMQMWIARRAYEKMTYPGRLDQMVAGGQPSHLTAWETAIKECEEEAAIPETLARKAKMVGAINYRMEVEDGVRQDVIFNYDLKLPASFTPINADKEVAEFYLWPIEQVMETVEKTDEFKTNCNLVVIDFLIRHGWLQETHPDYLALLNGLHPPL